MGIYKLTNGASIIRQSDGAYIPIYGGNKDYQEYLAWIALGNTADPADMSALDSVRQSQIATVSQSCQVSIYAGFSSSALGAAYHYPALDKDQANLAASVLASLLPGIPVGWTTPFWCEDATNVWALRMHTAAQIQQVGIDAKTSILAAMTRNETLSTQIMNPALTTAAEIQAIVW